MGQLRRVTCPTMVPEDDRPANRLSVTSMSASTDIRVKIEAPDTARGVYERVCQLYVSVFSGPPFYRTKEKLEAQRRTLQSLMADSTFGMVTAWDKDELAGFAYGYGLGSNRRWWDGFLEPVPEETTREWEGRTFVIIDMAVDPSHRRQSIGRKMLSKLLANRSEERASLAVVPENDNAQEFYRHLGWQHVGRVKGAPHHSAPFFDKYVLRLH